MTINNEHHFYTTANMTEVYSVWEAWRPGQDNWRTWSLAFEEQLQTRQYSALVGLPSATICHTALT